MTLWIHGAASTYYYDRNLPPKEGWRLIREMGFTHVQLWIDSSQLITGPRRYDLAMRLDRDIEIFTKLGFKILMKPMWAPAHMSGGKPAYAEYVYGSSVYRTTDPRDGWRYADRCGWLEGGVQREAGTHTVPGACGKAKDDPFHAGMDMVELPWRMEHHQFTPEKSFALPPNIPHLDPNQMYDYAVVLARHIVELAKRFKFRAADVQWCNWNELGGPWYWPPVYGDGPYEPAFDRFTSEIWAPFMMGVRSVLPRAFFIGPDAESPGSLDFFLGAIKRFDRRWLPNAISGHLYGSGSFPEGAVYDMERDGGWLEVMARHGYETIMNLEYGDSGNGKIVTGTRELLKRFHQIAAHAPLDTGQWFEGGQGAWNAGEFVPNDTYCEMKALIRAEQRVRGRVVRA